MLAEVGMDVESVLENAPSAYMRTGPLRSKETIEERLSRMEMPP